MIDEIARRFATAHDLHDNSDEILTRRDRKIRARFDRVGRSHR
jgi:hypothetical protein